MSPVLININKNVSPEVMIPQPKTYFKQTVHPDQKYITALLNNDSLLLKEMYYRFFGKVKSMIVQNNGTETDAADIFQDVLLCIYRKIKKDNLVLTCPLEGFLYLLCKKRWMSELRKRKCSQIAFMETKKYENIGDDNFKQIDEHRLQQARKDLLTEQLSAFNKTSQELLYLNWSGKSMKEVAKMFNVSYGYARKKKSECVTKLIELIKKSPKFNSLKWQ